jgi:NitT/TauT family transport system substrate-binding protein
MHHIEGTACPALQKSLKSVRPAILLLVSLPDRMDMSCRLYIGFFLLSIAVLLGSCHHVPSDNGLTKVSLQADWYPQPEHGGFYTALEKGYYKQEGLDVEIHSGGPYLSAYQQVASGGAQLGMGASDRILEGGAEGQPLVAVAATMQHDPQGIMVHADSPVHSFADLNGHSVAVLPGATWFRFLTKRYQLNNVHEVPATMSVANFIANPNYIQQAFATSEPFFARQAGVEPRLLLVSDSGFDTYRVMFTTREFLQKHPDVIAKFVRASLHGWRDYLSDPSVAHAAVARLNPALSPAWMQFSWQQLKDGQFVTGPATDGSQLGQMDPARWTALYKQLLDLKVIDKEIDPTTAYTLQFVKPN